MQSWFANTFKDKTKRKKPHCESIQSRKFIISYIKSQFDLVDIPPCIHRIQSKKKRKKKRKEKRKKRKEKKKEKEKPRRNN